MRIEVERKFQPPDLAVLGPRIESLGGEKLGEKQFRDLYYDTPDYSLVRRDIWLRCRDGKWELKVPIDGDARRSGGERSVFEEIEGSEQVHERLGSLLGDVVETTSDLDAVLFLHGATPFADFTTTRTKWLIGDASLDADVASFGHAVMEIEVMVDDASEVEAAETEIARVAALVQAKPLGAVGGKLETYIRRHAPAVLTALVEEGIMHEEGLIEEGINHAEAPAAEQETAAESRGAAHVRGATRICMSMADELAVQWHNTPRLSRRGVAALLGAATSTSVPRDALAAVDLEGSSTGLGYMDDAGMKSYSQVQRAWEKSAAMSDTEKALAAKGVGAVREGESPKATKRRAMAGCSMDEFRKKAGYNSAADCNQNVLSGELEAILSAMDRAS